MCNEQPTRPEIERLEPNSKEWWAFSMLSDAQELISMGLTAEASQKINDVKRVLRGRYRILQDGFAIEVIR